jgi:F-type H+-transporting ATPase subunit gamma
MANSQALKRRITTAKNIKQLTKAMEMVSASKMRRAQLQALASRPYNRKLQSTLLTIAAMTDSKKHPLLKKNETGKDIIVLVSTDKSLSGSLNTNLFRGTLDYLESNLSQDNLAFIIIGQKARRFVVGGGYELFAEFSNLPDPIKFIDSHSVSEMIIKGYLDKSFKSVTFIYMDFISTLVQKIRAFKLLPLPRDWEELFTGPQDILEVGAQISHDYLFEPGTDEILEWLLPYYIEQVVYQTLMETKASEHSARMVAMKNASDNAVEIISDLTLQYNKQRQSRITSELLDNITSLIIVAD